jgi:hypothetical protein
MQYRATLPPVESHQVRSFLPLDLFRPRSRARTKGAQGMFFRATYIASVCTAVMVCRYHGNLGSAPLGDRER